MDSKAATDSRLKRGYFHDYHSPCIYLITVTVVDREPLLGDVTGDVEHAVIGLSEVGRAVKREVYALPQRYPQVQVLQYQIMPDHVHLVLRVHERLPEQMPIGNVVAAWKQACGKAYSALLWRDLKASPRDGQPSAQACPSREATFRSPEGSKPPYKPLFSKGYNDSILMGKGQLAHMIAYVQDNPRRLLIKRQNRGLFAIHRGLAVADMCFDAVGNLCLLQKPMAAVHCRSRWTDAEQQEYAQHCLALADKGTVLVGAFISKAEKAIEQAAMKKGLPVVRLVENGFNDLYKPIGRDFYACAEGRLLLLAPWPYHNDTRTITREQCQQLNEMAETISLNNDVLTTKNQPR